MPDESFDNMSKISIVLFGLGGERGLLCGGLYTHNKDGKLTIIYL